MPDNAIAAGIQTPGLSSLSSIIGIQQQKQALQIGAQQLAQEQARTQSATQQMNERLILQKAQATGVDPDGNSLRDENGEPDPNAFMRFAGKHLPLTGQGVVQNIINSQNSRIGLANAATSLSADQREAASGIVRAHFGDTNATAQTIGAELYNWAKQDPTGRAMAAYGNAKSLLDHLPPATETNGVQRDGYLNTVAQVLQKAATTAAQQAPSMAAYTAPKGELGFVQTNPLAAGNIGTRGPIVAQGPGPAQQIPYLGQAAATTAGATARAAGVGNADVDRGNSISASLQPSRAAIELTKEVDALADQINSGTFAERISKAAAAVGQTTETYARQVLKKDLGQIKTIAQKNAPTDSARETIDSGYPESTSDPQTIHTSMDYVRGSFRQNLARGDLLNRVRTKAPDLRGLQHADDTLTSATDPLMHEFASLKTPQERSAFYARNFGTDAARMKEFRDKVAGMGHTYGRQ